MSSVAYVADQVQQILHERANVLAKETGCIVRVRKFTGATLLQTLVFGFQQHPDAGLEQLASIAQVGNVCVSDTAVHERFTESCAQFLHQVLEEMTSVVVQAAQDVPIKLLRRFSAVLLEDSSSIALPDELAEVWQGCGGKQAHTKAAVKLHTRLPAQAGTAAGSAVGQWTQFGPGQSVPGRGGGAWQSAGQRLGLFQSAAHGGTKARRRL